MQLSSSDFGTKSFNSADVKKYLKQYYNIDFAASCDFTTYEIFKIVESSINKKPFGKFLIEFFFNSGRYCYDSDKDDASLKYISYCSQRFTDSGIIKAPSLFENKKPFTNELLRKQLKNWFVDVVPSRENVFLLAFALEMNCDELTVFLTKGICEKGLNYKNPSEVAAYHCLKNHKSYNDAVVLIEKSKEKSTGYYSERKNV